MWNGGNDNIFGISKLHMLNSLKVWKHGNAHNIEIFKALKVWGCGKTQHVPNLHKLEVWKFENVVTPNTFQTFKIQTFNSLNFENVVGARGRSWEFLLRPLGRSSKAIGEGLETMSLETISKIEFLAAETLYSAELFSRFCLFSTISSFSSPPFWNPQPVISGIVEP